MLDAQTPVLDHPLLPPVREALTRVDDPEIKKPITELGMVAAVEVDAAGHVRVEVLLTVSGCPMKDTLTREVTAAVSAVEGVTGVRVDLGVMSDAQRVALREQLKGGQTDREIPFALPGSLTKVIAVASGKGGVGKSSVTVNLALSLAAAGRSVGLLDADIYGHSVPAMLGIADAKPTSVEDMILPVPSQGLKVMSIGMLKPRRDQVIAWRGPILDRALTQMLADVYWGDLDYLLLDLPPGTGDVAISLGQKLPNAEVLVVTTPQAAAAEVAERAGTMASMMNQRVIGVVENMSYLAVTCPHCGEEQRHEVFGHGGGQDTADGLTTRLGYDVPLLAQIPLDPRLRAGGDEGLPVVSTAPDQPSARALAELATGLDRRGRGLLGRQLGLAPAGR
ncbi:ATP-binding protein involved in chromosome partitioning [Friedmanniella luteola]|uniref:Iron-sulfur cluster carrier protein n=1 Tax=Friedmanniella luteola TaxID=546871 RepID=A0A1H1NIX5_9ACTN|nr:Mrp/NBP35 family ATP-binding protein [Friedmanniella luteola]SDR99021.1 ATP-binding protein involved in chromosome partitioning [Friedmanniella luteola]